MNREIEKIMDRLDLARVQAHRHFRMREKIRTLDRRTGYQPNSNLLK